MVGFSGKRYSLRDAKGLTQQQLAERLGITKALISAYETDVKMSSLDILGKLARAFGVTTDYLMGIEERPMLDVSNLSQKNINILLSLLEELRR